MITQTINKQENDNDKTKTIDNNNKTQKTIQTIKNIKHIKNKQRRT